MPVSSIAAAPDGYVGGLGKFLDLFLPQHGRRQRPSLIFDDTACVQLDGLPGIPHASDGFVEADGRFPGSSGASNDPKCRLLRAAAQSSADQNSSSLLENIFIPVQADKRISRVDR
jgi:hypothetical protein